jgi:hypothetical protein
MLRYLLAFVGSLSQLERVKQPHLDILMHAMLAKTNTFLMKFVSLYSKDAGMACKPRMNAKMKKYFPYLQCHVLLMTSAVLPAAIWTSKKLEGGARSFLPQKP